MIKTTTKAVQPDDTSSNPDKKPSTEISYDALSSRDAAAPEQAADRAPRVGGTDVEPKRKAADAAFKIAPGAGAPESTYAKSCTTSGSNAGSEASSMSSDHGPLVASVGPNGDPESHDAQAQLTESEEALIARHTDMLAPKAAVPELRAPVRDGSEASSSSTLQPASIRNDTGSSRSSIASVRRDTAAADSPSESARADAGSAVSNSAPPAVKSLDGPAAPAGAKPPPTLGPMEPMEPMKPGNSISERKKLPPLNAGFPMVPGFPAGDPGAHTVLPGAPDAQGKRVQSLPSLVENARNMTADSGRGAVPNHFSTGNTNLMADIYTQPNGEAPYVPGFAARGERLGTASSSSRSSGGWAYEDGPVAGMNVASQGVNYAPSSPRSRDPRFSYTYPHGMLTGPAGILPENMEGLGPLHSQYAHVPGPPIMTLPPGVSYPSAAHAAMPVVPPGAPPQQHRPALPSAAYPVILNPQHMYPQLPAPPYVGNPPPDGMKPAPQQASLHMMPMSRETSVAPVPSSHAGHSGGPGGPLPGRHQQSFAPVASESRSYRCTYPGCEWSFVRSSDQKRHIRSHEKPSLQCPYWEIHSNCNRKGGLFYRLDVLKRHLRLVHLIRPANGADDGGSCRVCGRVFEHTRDFISHCNACAEDAKERMLREGGPAQPS